MSNGKIFGLIAGAGCLGLGCAGLLGLVAVAVLFPGKREMETVGGPIALYEKAADPETLEVHVPVDPIHYANVTRVKAEAPARFFARLPLSQETTDWYESDRFPPPSFVHDALCAGEDSVEQRFLEAARASVKAGADAAALARAYGDTLRYCANPEGLCEFASAAALGKEPAPVRDLLWSGLTECEGEKYDALFSRTDVPPLAYVRRAQRLRWTKQGLPAWDGTLEKAVRAAMPAAPGYEKRMAAMLLDADDPRNAKALLAIHAQAKDENEKHDIAMAMHRQKDPKAKAVFAAACKARKTDPMCDAKQGSASAATPAPTASPTADSLASCARGSERYTALECLQSLAALDRGRAAEVAKSMKPGDAYGAEIVEAITRWPEKGQIERRLAELGLIPAGGAGDAVTPREALEKARRAYSFDVETGMYPNEHDSLLRELAALSSADFTGVLFEETAPADDEGPYEIRAYVDGTRLATRAENLGDWYDVSAVLGLLNAVAKERGKPTRFVVLDAFDQTATVVAGPEDGVRKAIDEKLLNVGGADEARATGKAFEEQVMRAIERGELELGD